MKKNKLLLVITLLFSSIGFAQLTEAGSLYTGFRASRILQSYPNRQFPTAPYWNSTGKNIASKFTNATATGVWIVSIYWGDGAIGVGFPAPGVSIPYVTFNSVDQNESFLSYFDTSGVKVWLQVEPGAANMDTLISIVLNRYKHHSCVLGFGVDVEWYQTNLYPSGGKKVTDAEAQRWEQKVKAVDSNYTLFVKHYAQSWMPPTYRGNILFVDDSQGFTSLSQMVSEFKSWGSKFSPAKSAFQFGYPADSTWWKQYPDPMKTLGTSLLSGIPSCAGLFWVDFTITRVFPITSVLDEIRGVDAFRLEQNFPNPFNPSTTFSFTLPERSRVVLSIYNQLGQKVTELANGEKEAGLNLIEWNAGALASGIYFYELKTDKTTETKKLILLK